MLESFLLIGLPYLSILSLVFGSIYRLRKHPFSYSSQSSQVLESRALLWGSVPFHIGILVLLVGHAVPMLLPGVWHTLVAIPLFLYAVEAIGFAAALLTLWGLLVLLLRRGTNARLQANTTVGDFVVLGLLLFQVLVGLGVAAGYRWGSVWSTGTIAPYLWSLVVLHPDPTLVEELPPLVKLHLAGAWILFLVVPFSRLVHLFSFPFSYVVRPPQQVVWAGIRRLAATRSEQVVAERRQLLLKGGAGILGAVFLLSLGVFDKMFQFFRGPRMSPAEEIALLQKRLKRLESTARERNLQLERMQSEYIFVARLSELSETEGKYFIDYQMRPALAFRGPEGLPLLISAKCTHLGCTVASQLDEQGRVLCPCHISYFDIATGMPNTGSPAKTPLPHLGWVLMDDLHEIVAESPPDGPIQGEFESARLEVLGVYIARRYEEAT